MAFEPPAVWLSPKMDSLKRPYDGDYASVLPEKKRARTENPESSSFSPPAGPAPMTTEPTAAAGTATIAETTTPPPPPAATTTPTLAANMVDEALRPLTISDITKRLKAAVQEGWSRKFSSYDSVHVLLLLWEEDEAFFGDDLAGLENVFKSVYHYNTETYRIRTLQPESDLRTHIADFMQHNSSPSSLLILYYAGHVKFSPKTGEALLWPVYVFWLHVSSRVLSLLTHPSYKTTKRGFAAIRRHSDPAGGSRRRCPAAAQLLDQLPGRHRGSSKCSRGFGCLRV